MTVYLIVGTERGSTTVEKFGDVAGANARMLEIADDEPTWLVTCAADLATKPGPLLVKLHNALAPEGAAPVKKFETRTAGAERLFRLVSGNDQPKEAAPPAAPAAAPAAGTPSTGENEDDMKKKAKKAKVAKVAKVGGAKALIREESSRGKLLRIAVDNPGISLKSLASRAGVSGEGSLDAPARARLRLRKVADAIEGSSVEFGEKGDHVTFKLPKVGPTTLDKVFGK